MGTNRPYGSSSDLPREIPVFPLPGVLLLPRCDLPLKIFEPRYIAMIDAALGGNRLIGMIQPRHDAAGKDASLYAVGCAGRLTRFSETGDGRYIIALEGACRFRVGLETTRDTPYRTFEVDFAPFAEDLAASHGEEDVDRDAVFSALRSYADKHALSIDWSSISSAASETLVNALSMMSPFGAREKQALLEAADLRARAEMLIAITEIELAADSGGRGPLN